MKRGDKVRIKPYKGCCNNTLCFQEWEVLEVTRAHFSVIYEDIAIIKCNNEIEVVPVCKLEAL